MTTNELKDAQNGGATTSPINDDLDAVYAAHRAEWSGEPFPSFEELQRTSTKDPRELRTQTPSH